MIRYLRLVAVLAAVTMSVSLALVVVAGQGATSTAQSTAAPTPWIQRTPDGQPDLQGVWSNDTVTPLERPSKWAGKAELTDEELESEIKKLKTKNFEHLESEEGQKRSGGTGTYNAFWRRESNRPLRRTSLIIDPPDGKAPPISPEAVKRFAAYAKARGKTGIAADAELTTATSTNPLGFRDVGGDVPLREVQGGVDGRGSRADNPEDRALSERCITRGLIRLPGDNNPYYQILQAPGYVAIYAEMGNEVRIIPLDGRPHLPGRVRQWLGDSRGHWEGSTLVIDTTNVTDKAPWKGSFEGLHLVERFTRVDADTINVEVTVDDPTTWARPWKIAYPWRSIQASDVKDENGFRTDQLFEYACHEGNYSLPNTLSARRFEERAAAAVAMKAKK